MPDEQRARLSDEMILTHFGSAVLFCWNELPPGAQAQILDQANDVIGLAPVPDVRSRIVDLLSSRSWK